MLGLLIGIFGFLALCGGPIFVALGLSGTIVNLIGVKGVSGTMIPLSFFTANDSWVLLAAPFFLLSGNIMAACGPAESLFALCDKFFGHIKGGLSIAVITACALFGAVTGSAIATAIAIGSSAIPEMRKRGYNDVYTMGLVGVSATLGLLIPPSIYMILFAGQAQGNILEYFIAGYLPGILVAGILVVVARLTMPADIRLMPRALWSERVKILLAALPAIGMPVVIMVSIYSGVFTPTESAALSVLYCVVVCPLAYRAAFSWKELWNCCKVAARSSAQIFVILGAVFVFSNVLTYLKIPQEIAAFATSMQVSPLSMMFLMALVYFVFGMFIDPVPIMYLTLPIFLPLVHQLGIHMTYFMIMTVVMMMIAQVSPPFGIIIFSMAGIFKTPVATVIRGSLPFIVCLVVAAAILILFPQISLFLPVLANLTTY